MKPSIHAGSRPFSTSCIGSKAAAADNTTVAEFGERLFHEVVAKDRVDLTLPRRHCGKAIVPPAVVDILHR